MIATKRKGDESEPSDTKRAKVDDEIASTEQIQPSTTLTDHSINDAAASTAPSQDLDNRIDLTAESKSTSETEAAKAPDTELLVEMPKPQAQSKQTNPLPEAVIDYGEKMDVEFLATAK